jgi:hypothetical protein
MAPRSHLDRNSGGLVSLVSLGVLVVRCLYSAAPLQAQSQDAQAEARAAYTAGVDAFGRGENEKARDLFAQAEAKFASPNIELMLGRALMKLERNVEAHHVLTRALRTSRESPKYTSAGAAAHDELQELEKRVAIVRLRIASERGDETLLVNGAQLDRSEWTEPFAVEPGLVRVELSRPDAPPGAQQVELAAGSAVTLALKLPAAAAPAASEPLEHEPIKPASRDAHAKTRSPAHPAHRSRSDLRGFGYALVGVGAVGLAAFGVLGAMSQAQFSALEDACPDANVCPSKYRAHADRGQTYQTLANIALVAGAATLTTGVTLWIVSLPEERATIAFTPSSVELRGRF